MDAALLTTRLETDSMEGFDSPQLYRSPTCMPDTSLLTLFKTHSQTKPNMPHTLHQIYLPFNTSLQNLMACIGLPKQPVYGSPRYSFDFPKYIYFYYNTLYFKHRNHSRLVLSCVICYMYSLTVSNTRDLQVTQMQFNQLLHLFSM